MDEIEKAILNFNGKLIKADNEEHIISKVRREFIHGNPRAWWTALKEITSVSNFDDCSAYLHIEDIFPIKDENVWLIVDDDSSMHHVYLTPISLIKYIIPECQFFEYYIVDTKFNWLLAENDHNQLLVCKATNNHC